MSGVVEFVPADFKAAYPEFSGVGAAVLERCFNEAALLLSNKPQSRVCNLEERKTLLWLLTAHIVYIHYGPNGTGTSGLTGPMVSATQGSVSVSVSQAGFTKNNAWYMLSPYGAQYWSATAKYRAARYLPGQSYPEPRRWYGF